MTTRRIGIAAAFLLCPGVPEGPPAGAMCGPYLGAAPARHPQGEDTSPDRPPRRWDGPQNAQCLSVQRNTVFFANPEINGPGPAFRPMLLHRASMTASGGGVPRVLTPERSGGVRTRRAAKGQQRGRPRPAPSTALRVELAQCSSHLWRKRRFELCYRTRLAIGRWLPSCAPRAAASSARRAVFPKRLLHSKGLRFRQVEVQIFGAPMERL